MSPDPVSPEVRARWDFAVQIAREAGRHTLQFFRREFEVERKSDQSPVTIADREAEQILRRRIQDHFPHDAIIGEEFGESAGTSGYRWILDPIDGTKSFISGVPLYSTLLGIDLNGESLIGVIFVPGLDEIVHAARGGGAWYQQGTASPQPARVSKKKKLADGLFITSQVDSFAKRNAAETYYELERAAYVTRTWGDGYGYLLVATGRAEAMVDPIMQVWDAASLKPIMEEAGGTFTDWKGVPTVFAGEGVATNGLVLEEVLAATRRG